MASTTPAAPRADQPTKFNRIIKNGWKRRRGAHRGDDLSGAPSGMDTLRVWQGIDQYPAIGRPALAPIEQLSYSDPTGPTASCCSYGLLLYAYWSEIPTIGLARGFPAMPP